MSNPYLKALSEELNYGIEKMRNLQFTIGEFQNDSPNVDGINGKEISKLIDRAIHSINEATLQVGMLNDFVKEVNDE